MSQLTMTDRRSISPPPSRREIDEHKMSVTVVATPADLARFLPAWEDLAASALEPNVFYEPWMMMPALHNLGAAKTLLISLIFTTDPARTRNAATLWFIPTRMRARIQGAAC